MKTLDLRRCRPVLAALALAGLLAVGCGGEVTDITAAVDDTNKTLQPQGASIDCPDEVDGGDGTEFECTLEGTKTGETASVDLRIAGDSIEPVEEAEYVAALGQVTGE